MIEDKELGRKSRAKVPEEFKDLHTLDEPVCETIVSHHFTLPNYSMKKRDLSKIWLKLRIVINPLTPMFNEDR
jgi:hypothetical protein